MIADSTGDAFACDHERDSSSGATGLFASAARHLEDAARHLDAIPERAKIVSGTPQSSSFIGDNIAALRAIDDARRGVGLIDSLAAHLPDGHPLSAQLTAAKAKAGFPLQYTAGDFGREPANLATLRSIERGGSASPSGLAHFMRELQIPGLRALDAEVQGALSKFVAPA